jgi:hypothetical protein
MKRLLMLLPAIMLTGCLQTVPVKMSFPAVPEELTVACPDLQLIDTKTTKLSEVVSVVSSNYGQYQECQVKVDQWIQWYNTQKKIFEEVK